MLNIGKCRLCKLDKPLLNKSHIIPNFMYGSLFDSKHKLYKFTLKDLSGRKMLNSKLPNGEYEGGLLCSKCDNEIIGGYETYARKALYGSDEKDFDLPQSSNFISESGIKFTKCRNLHYKEFKLFLLSILWRSSISNRDFFKEVNLGRHEESIRKMILKGDPKGDQTFPILMLTWLGDKSLGTDLVGQPGINLNEHSVRYIFPIAGVVYIFNLSTKSIPEELKGFILSSKNEATFLHLPEGKSSDYFLTYFGLNR